MIKEEISITYDSSSRACGRRSICINWESLPAIDSGLRCKMKYEQFTYDITGK